MLNNSTKPVILSNLNDLLSGLQKSQLELGRFDNSDGKLSLTLTCEQPVIISQQVKAEQLSIKAKSKVIFARSLKVEGDVVIHQATDVCFMRNLHCHQLGVAKSARVTFSGKQDKSALCDASNIKVGKQAELLFHYAQVTFNALLSEGLLAASNTKFNGKVLKANDLRCQQVVMELVGFYANALKMVLNTTDIKATECIFRGIIEQAEQLRIRAEKVRFDGISGDLLQSDIKADQLELTGSKDQTYLTLSQSMLHVGSLIQRRAVRLQQSILYADDPKKIHTIYDVFTLQDSLFISQSKFYTGGAGQIRLTCSYWQCPEGFIQSSVKSRESIWSSDTLLLSENAHVDIRGKLPENHLNDLSQHAIAKFSLSPINFSEKPEFAVNQTLLLASRDSQLSMAQARAAIGKTVAFGKLSLCGAEAVIEHVNLMKTGELQASEQTALEVKKLDVCGPVKVTQASKLTTDTTYNAGLMALDEEGQYEARQHTDTIGSKLTLGAKVKAEASQWKLSGWVSIDPKATLQGEQLTTAFTNKTMLSGRLEITEFTHKGHIVSDKGKLVSKKFSVKRLSLITGSKFRAKTDEAEIDSVAQIKLREVKWTGDVMTLYGHLEGRSSVFLGFNFFILMRRKIIGSSVTCHTPFLLSVGDLDAQRSLELRTLAYLNLAFCGNGSADRDIKGIVTYELIPRASTVLPDPRRLASLVVMLDLLEALVKLGYPQYRHTISAARQLIEASINLIRNIPTLWTLFQKTQKELANIYLHDIQLQATWEAVLRKLYADLPHRVTEKLPIYRLIALGWQLESTVSMANRFRNTATEVPKEWNISEEEVRQALAEIRKDPKQALSQIKQQAISRLNDPEKILSEMRQQAKNWVQNAATNWGKSLAWATETPVSEIWKVTRENWRKEYETIVVENGLRSMLPSDNVTALLDISTPSYAVNRKGRSVVRIKWGPQFAVLNNDSTAKYWARGGDYAVFQHIDARHFNHSSVSGLRELTINTQQATGVDGAQVDGRTLNVTNKGEWKGAVDITGGQEGEKSYIHIARPNERLAFNGLNNAQISGETYNPSRTMRGENLTFQYTDGFTAQSGFQGETKNTQVVVTDGPLQVKQGATWQHRDGLILHGQESVTIDGNLTAPTSEQATISYQTIEEKVQQALAKAQRGETDEAEEQTTFTPDIQHDVVLSTDKEQGRIHVNGQMEGGDSVAFIAHEYAVGENAQIQTLFFHPQANKAENQGNMLVKYTQGQVEELLNKGTMDFGMGSCSGKKFTNQGTASGKFFNLSYEHAEFTKEATERWGPAVIVKGEVILDHSRVELLGGYTFYDAKQKIVHDGHVEDVTGDKQEAGIGFKAPKLSLDGSSNVGQLSVDGNGIKHRQFMLGKGTAANYQANRVMNVVFPEGTHVVFDQNSKRPCLISIEADSIRIDNGSSKQRFVIQNTLNLTARTGDIKICNDTTIIGSLYFNGAGDLVYNGDLNIRDVMIGTVAGEHLNMGGALNINGDVSINAGSHQLVSDKSDEAKNFISPKDAYVFNRVPSAAATKQHNDMTIGHYGGIIYSRYGDVELSVPDEVKSQIELHLGKILAGGKIKLKGKQTELRLFHKPTTVLDDKGRERTVFPGGTIHAGYHADGGLQENCGLHFELYTVSLEGESQLLAFGDIDGVILGPQDDALYASADTKNFTEYQKTRGGKSIPHKLIGQKRPETRDGVDVGNPTIASLGDAKVSINVLNGGAVLRGVHGVSEKGTQITAKKDIKFLPVEVELKRTKMKKQGWFGPVKKPKVTTTKVTIPNVILGGENKFESKTGTVDGRSLVVEGTKISLLGKRVVLSRPVEKHSWRERGFYFSIDVPGKALIDAWHQRSWKLLIERDPALSTIYDLIKVYKRLKQGRKEALLELALALANLGIQGFNDLDKLSRAIEDDSLLLTLLQRYNLSDGKRFNPKVKVGLNYIDAKGHYKTLGEGHIECDEVVLKAGDVLEISNGYHVHATEDMTVDTEQLLLLGAALDYDEKVKQGSVDVGVNIAGGTPTVGVAGGYSSTTGVTHQNAELICDGHANIRIGKAQIRNGNIKAKTASGHIEECDIESVADKHKVKQGQFSINTDLDIGGNVGVYERRQVNVPSGIHVNENLQHLTFGDVTLKGSKITTDGQGSYLVARTVTLKSVKEFERGFSFGFNANLHEVAAGLQANRERSTSAIPTIKLDIKIKNYEAVRRSDIPSQRTVERVSGKSANGKPPIVKHDVDFDLKINIPLVGPDRVRQACEEIAARFKKEQVDLNAVKIAQLQQELEQYYADIEHLIAQMQGLKHQLEVLNADLDEAYQQRQQSIADFQVPTPREVLTTDQFELTWLNPKEAHGVSLLYQLAEARQRDLISQDDYERLYKQTFFTREVDVTLTQHAIALAKAFHYEYQRDYNVWDAYKLGMQDSIAAEVIRTFNCSSIEYQLQEVARMVYLQRMDEHGFMSRFCYRAGKVTLDGPLYSTIYASTAALGLPPEVCSAMMFGVTECIEQSLKSMNHYRHYTPADEEKSFHGFWQQYGAQIIQASAQQAAIGLCVGYAGRVNPLQKLTAASPLVNRAGQLNMLGHTAAVAYNTASFMAANSVVRGELPSLQALGDNLAFGTFMHVNAQLTRNVRENLFYPRVRVNSKTVPGLNKHPNVKLKASMVDGVPVLTQTTVSRIFAKRLMQNLRVNDPAGYRQVVRAAHRGKVTIVIGKGDLSFAALPKLTFALSAEQYPRSNGKQGLLIQFGKICPQQVASEHQGSLVSFFRSTPQRSTPVDNKAVKIEPVVFPLAPNGDGRKFGMEYADRILCNEATEGSKVDIALTALERSWPALHDVMQHQLTHARLTILAVNENTPKASTSWLPDTQTVTVNSQLNLEPLRQSLAYQTVNVLVTGYQEVFLGQQPRVDFNTVIVNETNAAVWQAYQSYLTQKDLKALPQDDIQLIVDKYAANGDLLVQPLQALRQAIKDLLPDLEISEGTQYVRGLLIAERAILQAEEPAGQFTLAPFVATLTPDQAQIIHQHLPELNQFYTEHCLAVVAGVEALHKTTLYEYFQQSRAMLNRGLQRLQQFWQRDVVPPSEQPPQYLQDPMLLPVTGDRIRDLMNRLDTGDYRHTRGVEPVQHELTVERDEILATDEVSADIVATVVSDVIAEASSLGELLNSALSYGDLLICGSDQPGGSVAHFGKHEGFVDRRIETTKGWFKNNGYYILLNTNYSPAQLKCHLRHELVHFAEQLLGLKPLASLKFRELIYQYIVKYNQDLNVPDKTYLMLIRRMFDGYMQPMLEHLLQSKLPPVLLIKHGPELVKSVQQDWQSYLQGEHSHYRLTYSRLQQELQKINPKYALTPEEIAAVDDLMMSELRARLLQCYDDFSVDDPGLNQAADLLLQNMAAVNRQYQTQLDQRFARTDKSLNLSASKQEIVIKLDRRDITLAYQTGFVFHASHEMDVEPFQQLKEKYPWLYKLIGLCVERGDLLLAQVPGPGVENPGAMAEYSAAFRKMRYRPELKQLEVITPSGYVRLLGHCFLMVPSDKKWSNVNSFAGEILRRLYVIYDKGTQRKFRRQFSSLSRYYLKDVVSDIRQRQQINPLTDRVVKFLDQRLQHFFEIHQHQISSSVRLEIINDFFDQCVYNPLQQSASKILAKYNTVDVASYATELSTLEQEWFEASVAFLFLAHQPGVSDIADELGYYRNLLDQYNDFLTEGGDRLEQPAVTSVPTTTSKSVIVEPARENTDRTINARDITDEKPKSFWTQYLLDPIKLEHSGRISYFMSCLDVKPFVQQRYAEPVLHEFTLSHGGMILASHQAGIDMANRLMIAMQRDMPVLGELLRRALDHGELLLCMSDHPRGSVAHFGHSDNFVGRSVRTTKGRFKGSDDYILLNSNFSEAQLKIHLAHELMHFIERKMGLSELLTREFKQQLYIYLQQSHQTIAKTKLQSQLYALFVTAVFDDYLQPMLLSLVESKLPKKTFLQNKSIIADAIKRDKLFHLTGLHDDLRMMHSELQRELRTIESDYALTDADINRVEQLFMSELCARLLQSKVAKLAENDIRMMPVMDLLNKFLNDINTRYRETISQRFTSSFQAQALARPIQFNIGQHEISLVRKTGFILHDDRTSWENGALQRLSQTQPALYSLLALNAEYGYLLVAMMPKISSGLAEYETALHGMKHNESFAAYSITSERGEYAFWGNCLLLDDYDRHWMHGNDLAKLILSRLHDVHYLVCGSLNAELRATIIAQYQQDDSQLHRQLIDRLTDKLQTFMRTVGYPHQNVQTIVHDFLTSSDRSLWDCVSKLQLRFSAHQSSALIEQKVESIERRWYEDCLTELFVAHFAHQPSLDSEMAPAYRTVLANYVYRLINCSYRLQPAIYNADCESPLAQLVELAQQSQEAIHWSNDLQREAEAATQSNATKTTLSESAQDRSVLERMYRWLSPEKVELPDEVRRLDRVGQRMVAP